jgi:diguanylate cyclase (GGDEF)-like protein
VTPGVSALQPATELLQTALCGLTRILNGGDGIIATENNGLFVLDDAGAGVSLHAGTGQFAQLRAFAALPERMAEAVRVGFGLDEPALHQGAHVLVPLRTRTGARGCMVVAASAFPHEAVDPAAIFGRQVVQALENVVLYERATVDPLTKLYQRGFGLQRLEETLRLGTRLSTPTSILMLDVDHFKALNDTHGHAAGDLALRAISRAISSGCRTTDIVCRYGGEEILVVLPATSSAGARVLAERVRERIDALRVSFEGNDLRCTASVGVATHDPEEGADHRLVEPDALLRHADTALYAAKDQGRNRIAVGGDEP